MGGDSILSILLNSKMRKAGLSCSVKDIFEQRTISNFSKLLEKQQLKVETQTEQGILEGIFDSLPIQQWFFDKIRNKELSNPNHWNQSFIIKVPELDIKRLQVIISTLVEYHDILRVKYKRIGKGEYTQIYCAQIDIPKLKVLDVSKITGDKRHELLTTWQNNFNLEEGRLWQIGYLHGYQDKTARIYFALHHLIVDSVSWRILIEDIRSLYNGEKLQEKTTSYRQWVRVVNEYAIKNQEEQKYWAEVQQEQQDYNKYDQLKVTEEPEKQKIELDKSLTKALLTQANIAYHTEINDLLLTALGYALKSWNNNIVNHITLEGHGREHIQEEIDLSKTVGWFTTAYPVKLEIQETLNQSIKYIKESLRGIPNKGLGYGALKQFQDKQTRGKYAILKDLPIISFNYLGQFDSQKGLWQITGEDSGESADKDNKDTNIININGLVVDGKLSFNIASKLSKEETQNLASEFKRQLEEITKHCIDKIKAKKIENTPSDFIDYTPYVTFHNNSKPPLFIFPPGDGGAESYFNNS
jgi:non-ribosomal peptide synthase protein (TIGR01720 family)